MSSVTEEVARAKEHLDAAVHDAGAATEAVAERFEWALAMGEEAARQALEAAAMEIAASEQRAAEFVERAQVTP